MSEKFKKELKEVIEVERDYEEKEFRTEYGKDEEKEAFQLGMITAYENVLTWIENM